MEVSFFNLQILKLFLQQHGRNLVHGLLLRWSGEAGFFQGPSLFEQGQDLVHRLLLC